jgi:hypothetical protein
LNVPVFRQIQLGFGVPGQPLGQYAQAHWSLGIGVFALVTPVNVCEDTVQNWAWLVSVLAGW